MAKSPSAYTGPQREVTLFVMQKVPGGGKLQAYIVKGFASGSPNFGLGAMYTGKF